MNIAKTGTVNAAYLFEDISLSKTDVLDIVGANYHMCGIGEYDPDTYLPTLEGQMGVIYLTPRPDPVVNIALAGITIVSENGIGYIYNGASFEEVDLSEYFEQDTQINTLTALGDYPLLQDGIKAQVGNNYIVVREFIEW